MYRIAYLMPYVSFPHETMEFLSCDEDENKSV